MRTTTKISLAAGFGGISPNIFFIGAICLAGPVDIPGSTRILTYMLGLLLFSGMGAGVAFIWGEKDLKRAFYLGLGLPAFMQLNLMNLDEYIKKSKSTHKRQAQVSWLGFLTEICMRRSKTQYKCQKLKPPYLQMSRQQMSGHQMPQAPRE